MFLFLIACNQPTAAPPGLLRLYLLFVQVQRMEQVVFSCVVWCYNEGSSLCKGIENMGISVIFNAVFMGVLGALGAW